MKLAIYHNLPSGGGKRALYEMTARLANNHAIDVYSLSCANHAFCDIRPFARRHSEYPHVPLPLAGSPFGRINQLIRSIDMLRRRRLEKRIARDMDAAGYDVVFVHNCQFQQSPNVLSFLRTPSAYYCAEPPRLLYEPELPRPYLKRSTVRRVLDRADPLPGLYRSLLARFDRINTRSATRVLVNSAYSRESFFRVYGLFAHTGYPGVDVERFRPLGLARENFVLSVGAVRPNKGFDFLIKSLAYIARPQRPALVIVSNYTDLDERGYLEQLASQAAVEVRFSPLASDDDLVKLYNQAGLTVYAPVMEPFGFVPLESMACATPVVAVREAGVRESVIDDETGRLTDRDPQEFAEAVTGLLTDAETRRRFGEQGRAHVVKHWQWEYRVQEIERQLRAAAQGPSRSP